ncbi:hypothetical protein [Aestuariimicrobium sp. T2.26MG-19.2B]|uniref:hypothetical protein n=1 Tax=Aestuariimicrobium sp. T2.26MG-19.2B TaxID=3040679 RepID=UPI002541AEE3|nr:hypothetical protein [Aestuariimicrobium sp. T2.26MG-19.2B]
MARPVLGGHPRRRLHRRIRDADLHPQCHLGAFGLRTDVGWTLVVGALHRAVDSGAVHEDDPGLAFDHNAHHAGAHDGIAPRALDHLTTEHSAPDHPAPHERPSHDECTHQSSAHQSSTQQPSSVQPDTAPADDQLPATGLTAGS